MFRRGSPGDEKSCRLGMGCCLYRAYEEVVSGLVLSNRGCSKGSFLHYGVGCFEVGCGVGSFSTVGFEFPRLFPMSEFFVGCSSFGKEFKIEISSDFTLIIAFKFVISEFLSATIIELSLCSWLLGMARS